MRFNIPLIVLIVMIFSSYSSSQSERWILYNENHGIYYYYDSESIGISGNNVWVWVKHIYTGGWFDENGTNDYDMKKVEINCVKRSICIHYSISYYANGKSISENSDEQWYPIPETLYDKLISTICSLK